MQEIHSADFNSGKKKLCLCLIEFLINNVSIPEFQRQDDEHHTDVIFEHLRRNFSQTHKLCLVGQISLGKLENEEEISCLDGQHRLIALQRLVTVYPEISQVVTDVCVYECKDKPSMFDVYQKINSNKPVPMPRTLNSAVTMTDIKNHLRKSYSKYIKNSDSPRFPNFNLDTFEKEMNKRRLCEEIKDSKVFIGALEELNIFYISQDASQFGEWGFSRYQDIQGMMSPKGKKFYLGLYKSFEWLDRIKMHIVNKTPYDEMTHKFHEEKRIKIPKALRMAVWRKRFQGLTGKCFCCENNQIQVDDFECAHIEPRCLGGPTTLNNLEPTCRSCNQDMGTMNLIVYKKSLND
jgi:hypothetical protein